LKKKFAHKLAGCEGHDGNFNQNARLSLTDIASAGGTGIAGKV